MFMRIKSNQRVYSVTREVPLTTIYNSGNHIRVLKRTLYHDGLSYSELVAHENLMRKIYR